MIKKYIELIKSYLYNKQSQARLYYIVEFNNWSIREDGINITKNLSKIKKINSIITTTSIGIRNSIIHFGSLNMFLLYNKYRFMDNFINKSNKVIVTWFHVNPNDSRINIALNLQKFVDIWHTSCQTTKRKLIGIGIPEKKIVVVPLGVDLKVFTPTIQREKEYLRQKFGIPKDKIVIGSFQKDGEGWGKGLSPKFIKGPDIFCKVVRELSKEYDIFVLLSGPARGYVKRKLDEYKVPYLHKYVRRIEDVAKFYKVIDLYFISSREEGGPKAVLESLASGVPLITTRVGMVDDIIVDGFNGFVCEVEDIKCLISRAKSILNNNRLRSSLIAEGLNTIQNYDWQKITDEYYEKIYKDFFNK